MKGKPTLEFAAFLRELCEMECRLLMGVRVAYYYRYGDLSKPPEVFPLLSPEGHALRGAIHALRMVVSRGVASVATVGGVGP